jgi:uncharacterized membrane protein YdjX (TVP38/TMEM64 family)
MLSDELQEKKKKQKMISSLVTTLLFVVVIGVIFAFDFAKIQAYISKTGVWGIFLSIIIYGLLGFTIIPSEPLTLLIGAMFGPWIATIASLAGNTLSSLAEYSLGHRIGSATNFMQLKEKLPFGLGKLKVDSLAFLIFARAIPGFGGKTVSIISGVYHVKLWRFIWTAFVTLIAGSFAFAFGGHGLALLIQALNIHK